MKKVKAIIIFLVLVFMMSCNCGETKEGKTKREILESKLTVLTEKAYFEGQRDAINGDVRIEKDYEGVYYWSRSCWDSGKVPIYNPTYEDSQIEE